MPGWGCSKARTCSGAETTREVRKWAARLGNASTVWQTWGTGGARAWDWTGSKISLEMQGKLPQHQKQDPYPARKRELGETLRYRVLRSQCLSSTQPMCGKRWERNPETLEPQLLEGWELIVAVRCSTGSPVRNVHHHKMLCVFPFIGSIWHSDSWGGKGEWGRKCPEQHWMECFKYLRW